MAHTSRASSSHQSKENISYKRVSENEWILNLSERFY